MTEIVDLSERRAAVENELVDKIGTLLRLARKGELIEFAAVYVAPDGQILTTYHFASALECLGAIDVLHDDAKKVLSDPEAD